VGLTQAWPRLEVKGEAYQCGYRHGWEAGDLVSRTLVWLDHTSGALEGSGGRAELAHAALGLLPAVERASPAFVQEVRGLADGARIEFEDAWLIQCRSEFGGCTAFAYAHEATTNGSPLAGQNQDLAPEFADIALLLHVSPDDGRPAILMWTFAGQLGYAGMNDRGLALFHTALYGFPSGAGIPRQVVKRLTLEQSSTAEAVAWLAAHRAASAGNFMFCDASGALADVEVTPEGCAIHTGERAELLHSNHCITRKFLDCDRGAPADSIERLSRIQLLGRSAWGQLTVEVLKDVLADHSGDPAGICRHGSTGWYSIAGYIAEPAARLLHVRRGPGCLHNWAAYQV
jgi:isopenicillin-N N-acyltransferase like protein